MQDLQPELGSIGIEDIWLNPKSRDDISTILLGLQDLYADVGLRARLFALLENELRPSVNLDVRRPGVELRKFAVPGVVIAIAILRWMVMQGREPADAASDISVEPYGSTRLQLEYSAGGHQRVGIGASSVGDVGMR